MKPLYPEFETLLLTKDKSLVVLFKQLRERLLEIAPYANELLYNSHALTIAFSLTDKIADAFCHLPIFQAHVNLGFNRGALLRDPHGILQGTGKAIRHIKMKDATDFDDDVESLVKAAIELAKSLQKQPSQTSGKTVSHL